MAKISTRIYLEHQTNNIRAAILYTLIGVIAVMLLGWLQMAIKMQRVANIKTGCAVSFIFFWLKMKAHCTFSEPTNLRRIAKMYDLKQETECVTPKPKRTEIVDKILSVDRR